MDFILKIFISKMIQVFSYKTFKKQKIFLYSKKFANLNKNEKTFKTKIINFKNFLKKYSNRKIVFYGANNGLNSLLYTASKRININKQKIFIVDSDNNKWGKFIGSINKRINKPNIIKNSDLICVSSLSFYDEIILNLKKSNKIINLNDI